jgi:2-isopropylmalate synthase
MMTNNKIIIFDTTLRDGEQSPGASMNTEQKIQIAKQLEKLKVDIIEAGFAAASPGDFDAINQIAKTITTSTVCSLSRALESDIKQAGLAIAPAKYKRIHTFIATSPIHMKYKLRLSPDEVIKKAINAVKYAKTFVEDVEFSLEDAGRSEMSFMKEIIDAVIEAGAKTINIPDTVGYRLPNEIYEMIKELVNFIDNKAIVSVHNHNDLGLAVANSLAAVEAGARQVECTINGLGERAGNAAMEELVMAIKVRQDKFAPIYTNIDTTQISKASKLVATITGIYPQPNKAIVGKNAFAHESGIHQDGVLKYAQTYEIMKPSDIGLEIQTSIVLGKHSGRAAFKDKLIQLGFDNLTNDEINKAFERFKLLCDKKKDIIDDDIRMIITDEKLNQNQTFELVSLQVSDCSTGVPNAAVSIKKDDTIITDAAIGDGVIDAIFKTIDRITGYEGKLIDYEVKAVSEGKDALAKVICKVIFSNNEPAMIGHGLNIDTMVASAKAYISALNSYLSMHKKFQSN